MTTPHSTCIPLDTKSGLTDPRNIIMRIMTITVVQTFDMLLEDFDNDWRIDFPTHVILTDRIGFKSGSVLYYEIPMILFHYKSPPHMDPGLGGGDDDGKLFTVLRPTTDSGQ
uniref:Uncharacterized protein n=1 Tax=Daphnia galeata TaxID=27404 RepID=A0A8J2RYC3_9CRUS|nr:unnamed protein product [Daphnia galeata]